MKRLLLALSLTSLLIPSRAIAEEPCGNSYVILPNRQCANLTYLTLLGQARANSAAANEAFRQEFNGNLLLELDPYYIETPDQRDARYQLLAETSMVRDEANALTYDIETILFPIHVRMMDTFGETYR